MQTIQLLFGAPALNTDDGGRAARFAPVMRDHLGEMFPGAGVTVVGRPNIQWPLLVVEGLDRRMVERAVDQIIERSHDGRRS